MNISISLVRVMHAKWPSFTFDNQSAHYSALIVVPFSEILNSLLA